MALYVRQQRRDEVRIGRCLPSESLPVKYLVKGIWMRMKIGDIFLGEKKTDKGDTSKKEIFILFPFLVIM